MAETLNSLLTGNVNPLGAAPVNAFNMVTRGFTPIDNLSQQEAGLIQYHRDNLVDGRSLLKDGQTTTVNIVGITGSDGRIYNVPGYWDGRRFDVDGDTKKNRQDQIDLKKKIDEVGWETFPSFATGPESDIAAERLHKIIDDDMRTFTGGR